jgi:hypothetical protein
MENDLGARRGPSATGFAGFAIEEFNEPRAGAGQGKAEAIVSDTRVAPIFLHVRATRAQPPRRRGRPYPP